MPQPQEGSGLKAGKDYPSSYGEMLAWFPDDDSCLDYLDWLRWPKGFVCPDCGERGGWKLDDGRFNCSLCNCRTSVTAGTIFHRTRTPLTLWFASAWHITSGKNGVAAKTLHRLLDFGSYQTAWTILHRFRMAMVRKGRERLSGEVEVDEMLIGGERKGARGRTASGKVLVAVAVERLRPTGFGRCRLRVIPNAEAPTLRSFLQDFIEPGSVVITDGWASYPLATEGSYVHSPFKIKGSNVESHVALPGVHRVSSLIKRWLMGTHQGAVEVDHLQRYLDEFAFRFNRRHSEFRGLLFRRLLEQAVQTPPMTYKSLVVNPKAKEVKPLPPAIHRVAPPSLAKQLPARPWRLGAQ